jgi:hypothetical protein
MAQEGDRAACPLLNGENPSPRVAMGIEPRGALQVHATSPAAPVPRARCRRINRPRSAAAHESASDAGKIALARGEVTHFQFK